MKETIKQMTEDGFAARKISRKLNLDFEYVRKIIKDNNYFLLKENFDDSKIKKAVSLYKCGISAKQIGFKFGIDKRRVQKWAKASGILRTLEQSHRTRSLNENVFDKIDNQNKAYWLGFLYADAYNNERKGTVNLALKGADHDHMKKYVIFFEGDISDIKNKFVKTNNKYHSVSLYLINSCYLSNRLKELGCPQAKSFIIKYPNWLDKNLNSHFVRGYFDGDGSIKIHKNKEWRINICGTNEILTSIQSFIKNNLNINSKINYISKTSNNTWAINISGNEQVKRLCDWLYSGAETYLYRKYDRYFALTGQQNNRKFLENSNRESYFLK